MCIRFFVLFPALLVATSAFGQSSASSAHADFINAQGEKIGAAVLTQTTGGVKLDVNVRQLPPGTHAFHIHAVGKCEVPDFKSAGGQFNPLGKQHGKDNPNGSHAGDMMNFEVGPDGRAKSSAVNAGVSHEKADDYKTDPAGNAGNRIACGVIQK